MSRFSYTLHNVIGHPVMELLRLIGLTRAADWVHAKTLPSTVEALSEDAQDAQHWRMCHQEWQYALGHAMGLTDVAEMEQLNSVDGGRALLRMSEALKATTNPHFHGLDCEEDETEYGGWYCECHIAEATRVLEGIDTP
jgi:hypothetical protein